MNEQDALAALLAAVTIGVARFPNATRVEQYVASLRPWIDDYGDARELKGHTEACENWNNDGTPLNEEWKLKTCGDDGWLCPNAPKQEV